MLTTAIPMWICVADTPRSVAVRLVHFGGGGDGDDGEGPIVATVVEVTVPGFGGALAGAGSGPLGVISVVTVLRDVGGALGPAPGVVAGAPGSPDAVGGSIM